jgi:ComF family protein
MVIGFVAPAECLGCGVEDHVVCEACAAAEIIDYGEHCAFCGVYSPASRTCIKCRVAAPRHVWVSTNYEGLARRLLGRYKFDQLRAAADDIAELMSQTFYDFGFEIDYLLVPVPTATSRRRQRGFDHASLLSRELGKKLGFHSADALGRLGQSRQLGAKREIRLRQAKDNYFVRLPELIKSRNILLVDDVITTGATLKAATKTLRRAGAKRIDALVFAKRL